MYYVYLNKLQLPVTPAALSMKINGQNKTVNLINDGEISIIKQPGLTDISFEFMIPHTKYPFASYGAGGFLGAQAILSYLEQLKTGLKPFQYIVSRMQGNKLLYSTNIKVTLESYDITESADNGLDLMCSVALKQYRPYSTKILVTDKNGKTTTKKTRG